MKRKRSNEDSNDATYKSTLLHPTVRECLTELYIAWKANGDSRKDFLDLLCQAGYGVPPRTLNNWVVQRNSNGSPLLNDKETGRDKSLTWEQQKLICGYIIENNNQNVEVHISNVSEFIFRNFGVKVSKSTVLRYVHDLGFENRVMQTKKYGFSVDRNTLSQIAYTWLLDKHQNTIFNTPRKRLCSIDFTYTGHRTDRRTTFSLKGSAQPHSGVSRSNYTNCIVTCIWADGTNRTPPILFTYNQKFRTNRRTTQKRADQVAHFKTTCKKYKIKKSRIIYNGRDTKETRNYVTESSSILKQFFQHYSIPTDSTVLSDQGAAFLEGGNDVLLSLGFKYHITYPSVVHQYLSPNDNRFHGSAKQKWRAMGLDYKDDIESSIALLYCLDECTHNSHFWFDQNLQINQFNTSQQKMDLLINGYEEDDNDFYKECSEEFDLFKKTDNYHADTHN